MFEFWKKKTVLSKIYNNFCIILDVNGTPVTEQVTMATSTNVAVTDASGNPVTGKDMF